MIGTGTPAPAAPPPPDEGSILPIPHNTISPLQTYAIGAFGIAVVAPMVGTIVLGHELSSAEFWHIELGAVLGPVGWLLADQMFPSNQGGPSGHPPSHGPGNANNINFP